MQNRHPPDVVHRLALKQTDGRIEIYARVLPNSNVQGQDCVFLVLRDEGVAGVVFLRNKSTYWPLAWLVLNSETHV